MLNLLLLCNYYEEKFDVGILYNLDNLNISEKNLTKSDKYEKSIETKEIIIGFVFKFELEREDE